MKKTKIKRIFIYNKISTLILMIGIFFITSKEIFATDSISQISNQSAAAASDTQDKIKELEEKAKIYREILEIKQKQSASLQNQIEIIDSNIDNLQSEIDLSKRKISEINDQIIGLEKQITEKNDLLISQKKFLSEMIQTYYEYSSQSMTNTFLSQDSVASFMIKKDRISQLGDKINEIITAINEIKIDLEKEKETLEAKKKEALSENSALEEKSSSLNNVIDNKQNLLSQTNGEQAKYAQLLAKVEAQKEELLSIDELSIAGGFSADNYEKPQADSFAPLGWYYSQKDSRWGNSKIGNSNSFMKDYGCAVTSVAMVLSSHGASQNPGNLARQKIFSWDLISWPKSFSGSKIALSPEGMSHGNINWTTIDKEILIGNPVIVYIGKTAGKGGHYVVIHHKAKNGKYVVHDPYFGANIYLDTSRALVGKMGVDSGTRMDQMIIYK
jgi:peptidoglycan hydrolase CwlO-like protein